MQNISFLEIREKLKLTVPGISLSGPILAVGTVNSLRIFAAFFASDLRLWGIGVFTILSSERIYRIYSNKRLLSFFRILPDTWMYRIQLWALEVILVKSKFLFVMVAGIMSLWETGCDARQGENHFVVKLFSLLYIYISSVISDEPVDLRHSP